MSRKFGWHSGTVTAQDGKFKGDLYVQDDIVFSDVSAGALGVTGGISFSGNYTGSGFACIDFTDATLDHTGSSGAAFIRAGTYGTPVSSSDAHQSGMIRLYGSNDAASDDGTGFYDRGIFAYLRTDKAKGIFPIAGLAEVRTTAGDGPVAVMACQFIADLNTTGAKLANTTGVNGMYGGWFKITAKDGATCGATSKKAAVWLDNQMNGNNAAPGEEYTIFATTGGLKPDAFIGFETSSSGWSNFLSFDETAYDQDPIGSADIDAGTTDKYLKVNINGTAYGIPMYHSW